MMILGPLETEASGGPTKDTTRLFHGPWHDHVGENIGISICAESFGMGNSLRAYRLYVSLTNISKHKSDANKYNFERKLNLTWKVKVNQPKNNSDLKQYWKKCSSKFYYSSLDMWSAIARTQSWRTHTHTDRRRRWPCPKVNIGLG